MKQNQVQQKEIRLGTHGEDYGSWMSNPVFYVVGALLALSVVLAVLSFTVFHITALGVVFVIAAVILLALLLWCAWIRRQYAFGGGGMMDRTHLVVLSHLDFDGQGQLLEVGCGSGPCPSGRPSPGRRPRWWALTIGAQTSATARPCARKTPQAKV